MECPQFSPQTSWVTQGLRWTTNSGHHWTARYFWCNSHSPLPEFEKHRGQVFILDIFICFSNLPIFFFNFLSFSIFCAKRLQDCDTPDSPMPNCKPISFNFLPVCVNERIISLRCGRKVFKKFLPVTCAFEDSFALISTWSYMIEGAGECYSQSASQFRSFIWDLFTPSAEDGLDPYSWLDVICQEWRLDPYVFRFGEVRN